MTPQQLIDSLPLNEYGSRFGETRVQNVLDVLKVRRVDVCVSSPLMGLIEVPREKVLERLQRWMDNFPKTAIAQRGHDIATVSISRRQRGKRVRYSLHIHFVGAQDEQGRQWTNL